jgi:hypothetical protein
MIMDGEYICIWKDEVASYLLIGYSCRKVEENSDIYESG